MQFSWALFYIVTFILGKALGAEGKLKDSKCQIKEVREPNGFSLRLDGFSSFSNHKKRLR